MNQQEEREICEMKNKRRQSQMKKAYDKFSKQQSHPRKEKREQKAILILKLELLDLQAEKIKLEREIEHYKGRLEISSTVVDIQDAENFLNYD